MRVETALAVPGECRSSLDMLLPTATLAMKQRSARPSWGVRSVGFIAKPERTHELASCIEGPVADLLQRMPGFAGVIVLHSQNQGRNLLVLTFWETEKQAATNCWEKLRAVRKEISSMVDVCTKVQTFRATAAAVYGRVRDRNIAEAC